MRLLATVLIAIFLTGCATGVPPEKKAGIRSIGIVWAMGDPITFKTVGVMVFTNEETKSPAPPDWRLDDLISGKIAEALRGRYHVTPIQVRPETFRVQQPGLLSSGPSLGDIVRAEVRPQTLDAYVVVQPTRSGDTLGNSNQTLEGMGLYRRWTIIGPWHFVYAGFDIRVVDGRDFKTIGSASTRLAGARVDDGLWAPNLAAMTDAQKQKLREHLVSVIEKDLAEKLTKLGL